MVWVARYVGPAGGADWAFDVAVDGSGNVYVTGKSYDSEGNDRNYACATVKYDGNGTQLWAARYDGAGEKDDIAYALAVDNAGAVYVIGTSGGDYATVKYDRDGVQRWAARYAGPEGSEDAAVAVGLDGAGNVYVTGSSGSDFATVKYDSYGGQCWVARYEGEAKAMAVDSTGNVYVTGTSKEKFATIKYDSAGNQIWVVGFSGPSSGNGEAMAIARDDSGNVFITGRAYSPRTYKYSWATVKYNNEGRQCWVARYDGTLPSYSYGDPVDMAIWQGNVYVAGKMWSEGWDFVTVRYDNDGNERWVDWYNGPSGGYDYVAAIAVDGQGNVYVTGKSDGGSSCADFATIKYVPVT
jgi:hypothetical protein